MTRSNPVRRGKSRPVRHYPSPCRRSLSLNPRRERPPATTRAIQLAHIGIDQSPMMTVHSIKIRTRWNSATTAKITPATRENVFSFMRDHPRGRWLRTSSGTIWLPYPESNISGHPARARHHRALPRVTGWRGPNASFEAPLADAVNGSPIFSLGTGSVLMPENRDTENIAAHDLGGRISNGSQTDWKDRPPCRTSI